MIRRRARWDTPSRSVLDALQFGVIVLDDADRLVLVNPAARQMGLVRSGTEHDELASTAVRTVVRQVRRGGGARTLELDLPGRGAGGGRHEPFGVNLRVAALDRGYVAVEAADVTEAHRLARVRRDFVANVSHELKTPVGALRLLAEALIEATRCEDGRDLPGTGGAGTDGAEVDGAEVDGAEVDLATVRRFAERIQHESTRLGRLVGDLLELTRLQGADPLPEPEPVAVDGIFAEVVDRSRTAATAKKIEIVVDGDRGLTVYGNEGQLVTAVTNLVENAVAYSPERTEVTITATTGDDVVEIAVADQGFGIEPRHLDRIFERFFRADKARSRATGGTGLGLAIVKHVATNHGGGVDVVSTVGVGSTFTLRLPARPLDAVGETTQPGEIASGPARIGRTEVPR